MNAIPVALAVATLFGAGDVLVLVFSIASVVLGMVIAGVLIMRYEHDNDTRSCILGMAWKPPAS